MGALPLPALIASTNALIILGLSLNSRQLTLFVFLPLSIFLCAQIGINSMDEAMPLERLRPMNAAASLLLRVLELLLCTHDPQLELRRDSDGKADISSQPFGKRIKWAAALCFTMRGAGWNWRVRGTPLSTEYASRGAFVLHTLVRILVECLVLEAITIIFARVGLTNTVYGPFIILHAMVVYLGMSIPYEMGNVVWVATGIGSVEECPPLFGSLQYSRSLRGFWGKTWHQSFRQVSRYQNSDTPSSRFDI